MGLAEQQACLARLLVDRAFQEDFFADPARVGANAGLSPAEADQTAQLSAERLRLAARSLQHKRLLEVQKLLSFTALAMGRGFDRRFWEYAPSFVPVGLRKHQQDALHFARFLTQQLRSSDPRGWVRSVIQYEAACLGTSEPRRQWTVALFRYDPRVLIWQLQSGGTETLPLPGPAALPLVARL